MTRYVLALWVVVASFVLAPGWLSAHHSEANYDHDTLYVVTGTVTDFEFVNPHIVLHFDVMKGGKIETWNGISASPNSMRRSGWSRATFKAGDRVVITGFLHGEGRKIMQMGGINLNGQELRASATGFDQVTTFRKEHPDRPPQKYN